MTTNQFLFKKVTNNLVDVFFGEEGFDSKEWVRMKRGQGTWIPSGDRQTRVRDAEFDFGCIIKMEDVLPLIIKELNNGQNNANARVGTKRKSR